jgi:hypothetical protein
MFTSSRLTRSSFAFSISIATFTRGTCAEYDVPTPVTSGRLAAAAINACVARSIAA